MVPSDYDDELLLLAHDVANRLLAAFQQSKTQIPYPRVSNNIHVDWLVQKKVLEGDNYTLFCTTFVLYLLHTIKFCMLFPAFTTSIIYMYTVALTFKVPLLCSILLLQVSTCYFLFEGVKIVGFSVVSQQDFKRIGSFVMT